MQSDEDEDDRNDAYVDAENPFASLSTEKAEAEDAEAAAQCDADLDELNLGGEEMETDQLQDNNDNEETMGQTLALEGDEGMEEAGLTA